MPEAAPYDVLFMDPSVAALAGGLELAVVAVSVTSTLYWTGMFSSLVQPNRAISPQFSPNSTVVVLDEQLKQQHKSVMCKFLA